MTFALPRTYPKGLLTRRVGPSAARVLQGRAPDREPRRRSGAFAGASGWPPSKVPRRVVILDEIPKGATGKLQRIGLAEGSWGLVEDA